MRLSIVIPCYNEGARMLENTQRVADYCRGLCPFEIIVSDDGSSDKETKKWLIKAQEEIAEAKVLFNEHKGKGAAVKSGLQASKGDIAIFFDADLATNLESIQNAMTEIESGADIAIGSRYEKDSVIVRQQSFKRKTTSKIFRLITAILVDFKFKDTQCGFKAFKKSCINPLFASLSTDGFCFDLEILMKAQKQNYTVAPIPVIWTDADGSSVRIWPHAIQMFLHVCTLYLKRILRRI